MSAHETPRSSDGMHTLGCHPVNITTATFILLSHLPIFLKPHFCAKMILGGMLSPNMSQGVRVSQGHLLYRKG